MINHIYKISAWKEGHRLIEVDCKIYTEDIAQTLKDLRVMDFGIEVDKYVHFNIKFVEREDINSTEAFHIGHINKTKFNAEEFKKS